MASFANDDKDLSSAKKIVDDMNIDVTNSVKSLGEGRLFSSVDVEDVDLSASDYVNSNSVDRRMIGKEKVIDPFSESDVVDVDNGNYDDIHKDLGTVSFDDANIIEIPVEMGPAGDNDETCACLSGACETDKYRIISFRSENSTKQRIKIYDKETNELVGELTSHSLDHTNGLATDGEYIYVANCGEEDDDHKKISYFTIDGVINGNAEIKTEKFHVKRDGNVEEEFVSGISHDYLNKDTCVTAVGSEMYISKADGSVYHVNKIDVPKDSGLADTTQDLCVANDRVYVIRTKFPSWFTKNVSADDGWNVIDIYDTNGNYIGSKTVDLPGEANDMFGNKYYRELESLSYDAATDSFTLYFQSPNWGENTVSGNHFSPPHNVVTNVKL